MELSLVSQYGRACPRGQQVGGTDQNLSKWGGGSQTPYGPNVHSRTHWSAKAEIW